MRKGGGGGCDDRHTAKGIGLLGPGRDFFTRDFCSDIFACILSNVHRSNERLDITKGSVH